LKLDALKPLFPASLAEIDQAFLPELAVNIGCSAFASPLSRGRLAALSAVPVSEFLAYGYSLLIRVISAFHLVPASTVQSIV
jgi:hypothetical protein